MKERIKQCRIRMKYSQKYVAISVGVATPTVSMWENGTKQPTLYNLSKLADLFGTSVDYLIGRADSSEHCQHQPTIPSSEMELLMIYRSLTPQGQEYIRQQFNIAKKIYEQSDPLSLAAT